MNRRSFMQSLRALGIGAAVASVVGVALSHENEMIFDKDTHGIFRSFGFRRAYSSKELAARMDRAAGWMIIHEVWIEGKSGELPINLICEVKTFESLL